MTVCWKPAWCECGKPSCPPLTATDLDLSLFPCDYNGPMDKLKDEIRAQRARAERAEAESRDARRERDQNQYDRDTARYKLREAEAEGLRAQALADYWMDAGADLQENHDRMEFRALQAEALLAAEKLHHDSACLLSHGHRDRWVTAEAALAEAELREDQWKVRAQLYGEALGRVRALCEKREAETWGHYLTTEEVRAAIDQSNA